MVCFCACASCGYQRFCLFVLFFKVFSWRRSLPGDASHNLFVLFFFGTALFLLWALGVIRSIGHLRPETQKCASFCVVLSLFSLVFGSWFPLARSPWRGMSHLVLKHLLALCARRVPCLRKVASAVLVRHIPRPSVSRLANASTDNVLGNGRTPGQARSDSPCQARGTGLHVLGIGWEHILALPWVVLAIGHVA